MRCLVFIVFFAPLLGYGQKTADPPVDFAQLEGLNLSEAIGILDKADTISFSFNPEALEGLTVPELPDTVTGISSFLKIALSGTPLTFERIATTYVIYPRGKKPRVRENFALTGVISDRKTNESLPYAQIKLTEINQSTLSNSNGKFTLLNVPSDTLSLTVTYLGYRPLSVNLSDTELGRPLILMMSPQERNLPSVQVSAETPEVISIDRNTSQFTFNPREISKLPNLGENDLFSALRRFPGIQGGTDASSGLQIRGGYSDQNLVLFDGIPIYHIDHFYGFLTAFNSNVVKNVQVLKGGFSSKYGSRGSGIINVTGIDGNKSDPSLQIDANMLSASVVAELPLVENKASLVFAFRKSFTDILQTPTYRNMFNNLFNSSIPNTEENNTDVFSSEEEPEYDYFDLHAKFNFRPSSKDDISISLYRSQDDLQYTFLGSFQDLSRRSEDDTNWGNTGGSVQWARKWNNRFSSNLSYGNSNYSSNLLATEDFFLSGTDTLLSTLVFEQRTQITDQTLRLDNNIAIDKNYSLEFGYWGTLYDLKLQSQNQLSILQDSSESAGFNAAYADLERRLGNWQIKAGLRASVYSEENSVLLEPRASTSYKVQEGFTLKAAYGIHHQFIRRLNERSLYLSVPETWTLARDGVVPILRSSHYIAGATLEFMKWEIDLEGYFKDETGSVEFLFPEFGNPTGNLDQFAVDGDRNIYGIDFMLKRSFKNQNVILGYTYLNAQSKYPTINDGEFFRSSGFSEHELNAIYNFEWKRWDFSAGFVLASGRPYTPVLGTFIVTLPNGEEEQFVSTGAINSAELDWYHRLDLGMSYTLPLKNGIFQAGLSLYNAYNNASIKYIDYFTIPNSGSDFFTLGQRDVLSLGFTPSVFLKLKI